MNNRDSAATDIVGLSDVEVQERLDKGQVNIAPDPPGRSVAQIVRANVLTPINAIMIVLFVLVVISGYWKDGLFVGVVFSNSVLGVGQEVKARRELDRLQVLTQPEATVIRGGSPVTIDIEQIVLDDIVVLSTGGQLPVDGEIVTATGLQLDESQLTGESLPVHKRPGDTALSGSFVVAGTASMHTTAVGADSYAAGLTSEAKAFRAAELLRTRSIHRLGVGNRGGRDGRSQRHYRPYPQVSTGPRAVGAAHAATYREYTEVPSS